MRLNKKESLSAGSPIKFKLAMGSILPAAISATSVSAVAIPSPAASATAATTSASASATTSAEAAASASTSATPAAFPRWPRLINNDVTTHEIVPVQTLNGTFGFVVAIDLHKSEPPRLPRKTVAHQSDGRRSDSRLGK